MLKFAKVERGERATFGGRARVAQHPYAGDFAEIQLILGFWAKSTVGFVSDKRRTCVGHDFSDVRG